LGDGQRTGYWGRVEKKPPLMEAAKVEAGHKHGTRWSESMNERPGEGENVGSGPGLKRGHEREAGIGGKNYKRSEYARERKVESRTWFGGGGRAGKLVLGPAFVHSF